jgi:predicted DNA-binding protein
MKKKSANFSVRLDPITRELLEKLSEREQRTAGSYIRSIVVREAMATGIIKSPVSGKLGGQCDS